MSFFFKKTGVTTDPTLKAVEAVQLWFVKWKSRHGEYPFDSVRQEMEAFTSEGAARELKRSLDEAFKLVRQTGYLRVTVEKN